MAILWRRYLSKIKLLAPFDRHVLFSSLKHKMADLLVGTNISLKNVIVTSFYYWIKKKAKHFILFIIVYFISFIFSWPWNLLKSL